MPLDLPVPLAALSALLLSFGGFAAIARGMNRHHAQFSPGLRTAPSTLASRIVGAVLLVAALTACIAGWGVSVGVVGWGCAVSVAAMALILLLSCAPQTTRMLAVWAPLSGFVIALAGIVA